MITESKELRDFTDLDWDDTTIEINPVVEHDGNRYFTAHRIIEVPDPEDESYPFAKVLVGSYKAPLIFALFIEEMMKYAADITRKKLEAEINGRDLGMLIFSDFNTQYWKLQEEKRKANSWREAYDTLENEPSNQTKMSTERKFTHKISMLCKHGEYLSIRIQLQELGYKAGVLVEDMESVQLNIGYKSVSYSEIAYFDGDSILMITFFNPELFLALAACSEGETFYPGEWVVLKNYTIGEVNAPAGTIAKVIETSKMDIRFEHNSKRAYALKEDFRKATVEEIIAHFSKKQEPKTNPIEEKRFKHGNFVEANLSNGKAILGYYIEKSALGDWHYVQEKNSKQTFQCVSVFDVEMTKVTKDQLVEAYITLHGGYADQIQIV